MVWNLTTLCTFNKLFVLFFITLQSLTAAEVRMQGSFLLLNTRYSINYGTKFRRFTYRSRIHSHVYNRLWVRSFYFCGSLFIRYYHWYYENLTEISTHNLPAVSTLNIMEKDDDPAIIQLLHFLLRNEHSKWGTVDGFYWTVNTTITVLSWINTVTDSEMGYAVRQLLEALRYKPEGLGFYSWLCHCNFSFNIILPIVLWTWDWLRL